MSTPEGKMSASPGIPRVPQVTLLLQGGRRVSCTVRRDSALDRPPGDPRGHVQYYVAVPDEPVKLGTYEVEHTTPPHTAFYVDVPRAGLEDIRPGGAPAPPFTELDQALADDSGDPG